MLRFIYTYSLGRRLLSLFYSIKITFSEWIILSGKISALSEINGICNVRVPVEIETPAFNHASATSSVQ